jgi:hypothetical protein
MVSITAHLQNLGTPDNFLSELINKRSCDIFLNEIDYFRSWLVTSFKKQKKTSFPSFRNASFINTVL